MSINRILVATDGSPTARTAVKWAGELAKSLGAEVILVHSFESSPYYPATMTVAVYLPVDAAQRQEEAARDLAGWMQPLHDAGVWCRSLLTEGRPARTILDAAAREKADLIVMGTRGHSGLAELVVGSVARDVSHHATIPVVVVPPAMAVHATRREAATATT
jgi:nucleotide-binding universal stress UspA family protein